MHLIEQLYQTLQDRKGADADESYAASLYEKGPEKMGRKVVEEATELLIEGIKGDKELMKQEAADLIFHIWVLLAHYDITPADISKVLESRVGVSGHDEKAARDDG